MVALKVERRVLVHFYYRSIADTRRFMAPLTDLIAQDPGTCLVGFAMENDMEVGPEYGLKIIPTVLDFRSNEVFRYEGATGIRGLLSP